jgi:hypothetical protein
VVREHDFSKNFLIFLSRSNLVRRVVLPEPEVPGDYEYLSWFVISLSRLSLLYIFEPVRGFSHLAFHLHSPSRDNQSND